MVAVFVARKHIIIKIKFMFGILSYKLATVFMKVKTNLACYNNLQCNYVYYALITAELIIVNSPIVGRVIVRINRVYRGFV